MLLDYAGQGGLVLILHFFPNLFLIEKCSCLLSETAAYKCYAFFSLSTGAFDEGELA